MKALFLSGNVFHDYLPCRIYILRQVAAMREEYRTIDILRRERETELVDLRKKLNAGDFTAAEQVTTILL